jgi:signal transduction histidine kinase
VFAEPKKIELKLDFPYDLPMVNADIGMMEKVLQNLLDNALKFTPEGGNIKISLTPEKQDILVSIKDNGRGISPDALPHIFDRYQKAERSTVTENEGLGLGLAIVKKILEVHNIEIKVESSKEWGTIFSYKVPIYKSRQAVQEEVEYS